MNAINSQKKHVFFRRVSTAGQDIITQEAADLPFREKLSDDEILIINEIATSANKKAIKERPEMQRLISLVKDKKVHSIYAFDRSRLFRDFYEGMEFNDLRAKYDVQVIYTSVGNGNMPASDDVFVEGLLSMFSDIEGKNIARRSREARLRYPAKKFGYQKQKETKRFLHDSSKSKGVQQYFAALKEISSLDDLYKVTKEYRKKLKKTDEQLVSMATDPFYAGYDLEKGTNKLQHVTPYISIEEFLQLQRVNGEFFKAFLERKKSLMCQNIYTPCCGYCRKPLFYKIEEESNSSYYSCSSKLHPKVTVSFSDLSKIIGGILSEIIQNFNAEKLINQSINCYRTIKKHLEAEMDSIDQNLNGIIEELVLGSDDYSADWKQDPMYKRKQLLKQEYHNCLEQIKENQNALQKNKSVIKVIEEALINQSNMNPSMLCDMLINGIWIYGDNLQVDVFYFDYLQEMEKEMIFEGEDIA
ncbi:recombinase family protein [Neobacillus sp. BF23-41]|uniref:recombinase family protein n=1 Tax=Neobacillus sp. BF23-41 TaxID=3240280 RepID=UPI0034E438CD